MHCSLGNRPFPTAIRYYQAFQEVNLSKRTLAEDVKCLKRYEAFFEDLHDRKCTRPPIRAILTNL